MQAFIRGGRSCEVRNFTPVTPHPQLTMARSYCDSTSCTVEMRVWRFKRGRSSTQFVRGDRLLNRWSEKKRLHSCETNSKRQSHRYPVTHHQICLIALHCAFPLRRPVQTAGRWSDCRRPSQTDSLAIAEIWLGAGAGVVQGPPQRFGHRPELAYRSHSMMNAQPQKALSETVLFLWIVYLFRWPKVTSTKKQKHSLSKDISACYFPCELHNIALAKLVWSTSTIETFLRRRFFFFLLRSKHPGNIVWLQQTHRNSVHQSVAHRGPQLHVPVDIQRSGYTYNGCQILSWLIRKKEERESLGERERERERERMKKNFQAGRSTGTQGKLFFFCTTVCIKQTFDVFITWSSSTTLPFGFCDWSNTIQGGFSSAIYLAQKATENVALSAGQLSRIAGNVRKNGTRFSKLSNTPHFLGLW